MPHFGPWEIGLVLLIIIIVFGVGKLPQVGGSIGKALREFRQARTDVDVDSVEPGLKEVK